MRFARALLLCGAAAGAMAAAAPAALASTAEAQLRRVLENTLGGQKLRLPEFFKSAVRTQGAGS